MQLYRDSRQYKRLLPNTFSDKCLHFAAKVLPANHSTTLGKIHFQRPLIAYDIILLNQPWHGLQMQTNTFTLAFVHLEFACASSKVQSSNPPPIKSL